MTMKGQQFISNFLSPNSTSMRESPTRTSRHNGVEGGQEGFHGRELIVVPHGEERVFARLEHEAPVGPASFETRQAAAPQG